MPPMPANRPTTVRPWQGGAPTMKRYYGAPQTGPEFEAASATSPWPLAVSAMSNPQDEIDGLGSRRLLSFERAPEGDFEFSLAPAARERDAFQHDRKACTLQRRVCRIEDSRLD
jgi:hypothetical protein